MIFAIVVNQQGLLRMAMIRHNEVRWGHHESSWYYNRGERYRMTWGSNAKSRGRLQCIGQSDLKIHPIIDDEALPEDLYYAGRALVERGFSADELHKLMQDFQT